MVVQLACGLNNQKMALWAAHDICKRTGRALVEPRFLDPSEHGGTGEEVPLRVLYDYDAFARRAGVRVVPTEDEPPEEELTSVEEFFREDPLWYAELGAVLARAQAAAETLFLPHAFLWVYEEAYIAQRRMRRAVEPTPRDCELYGALLPSARLSDLADRMVAAMGGGTFVAVHMRIEEEFYQDVVQRRQAAHGCEWVDGRTIRAKLLRTPAVAGASSTLFLTFGPNLHLDGPEDHPLKLFASDRFAAHTKHTLLGGVIAALSEVEKMALDYEVCRRAAAFVGTTRSTFDNQLAHDRAGSAAPCYIYNHAGDALALRTDRGLYPDPADAVGCERPL